MNQKIEFETLDINSFRRGLKDDSDFEFGLKIKIKIFSKKCVVVNL